MAAATTKPTIVLSQESRIALIAAATVAVGPGSGWAHNDKVQAKASEILLAAGDGSRLAIRLDDVANAKHFSGVITGIFKEEKSKRGILTLKTGTAREQKGLPLGFEQVRTDRTDSSDEAKQLCIKIKKEMLGHKVAVDVILEATDDAEKPKVRVVVGVRDLGVSDDAEVIALLAEQGIAAA